VLELTPPRAGKGGDDGHDAGASCSSILAARGAKITLEPPLNAAASGLTLCAVYRVVTQLLLM